MDARDASMRPVVLVAAIAGLVALAGVGALVWSSWLSQAPGPERPADRPFEPGRRSAIVVAVPGSDRFVVRMDDTGEELRVRTAGALGPPQDTCGFRAARGAARRLAPVGSRVEVIVDRRLGPTARVRRYAVRYLEVDGVDVGMELLRTGHALYSPVVHDATRIARTRTYLPVELAAYRLRLGVWGRCLEEPAGGG